MGGWRAGVTDIGLGLAGVRGGGVPVPGQRPHPSQWLIPQQSRLLPGAEHKGSEQELPQARPLSLAFLVPHGGGSQSLRRAPSSLGKPVPVALRISCLLQSLPPSAPALATLPPAKPLSRSVPSSVPCDQTSATPPTERAGRPAGRSLSRTSARRHLTRCPFCWLNLFFLKLQVLLSWLSTCSRSSSVSRWLPVPCKPFTWLLPTPRPGLPVGAPEFLAWAGQRLCWGSVCSANLGTSARLSWRLVPKVMLHLSSLGPHSCRCSLTLPRLKSRNCWWAGGCLPGTAPRPQNFHPGRSLLPASSL